MRIYSCSCLFLSITRQMIRLLALILNMRFKVKQTTWKWKVWEKLIDDWHVIQGLVVQSLSFYVYFECINVSGKLLMPCKLPIYPPNNHYTVIYVFSTNRKVSLELHLSSKTIFLLFTTLSYLCTFPGTCAFVTSVVDKEWLNM